LPHLDKPSNPLKRLQFKDLAVCGRAWASAHFASRTGEQIEFRGETDSGRPLLTLRLKPHTSAVTNRPASESSGFAGMARSYATTVHSRCYRPL
jgi:hypothetical protein